MDIVLIVFLISLLLSAFFSGTESALFSIEQEKLKTLKHRNWANKNRIHFIQTVLSQPETTLSMLLISNLSVNMVISYTGSSVMENVSQYLGIQSELLSLAIITVVLLIFGEIVPKVIAVQVSERWAHFATPFLSLWFNLVHYFALPVSMIANQVNKLVPDSSGKLGENELMQAIEIAEKFGILKPKEKEHLNRAVAFFHDTAYSAMNPKSELLLLPSDITPLRAKKAFLEKKHCTYAILYNKRDHSDYGYILPRHLWPALVKKQKSLRNRVFEVLQFPETMPLREVMHIFVQTGKEVGIVIDESGMFIGSLTLRDVLEKILGEFTRSQFQEQNPYGGIVKLNKGHFLIRGNISIDEFAEYFGKRIETEEAETIAGFLLEKLDGFPRADTVLRFRGWEFYDFKISSHRIEEAKMRITK